MWSGYKILQHANRQVTQENNTLVPDDSAVICNIKTNETIEIITETMIVDQETIWASFAHDINLTILHWKYIIMILIVF